MLLVTLAERPETPGDNRRGVVGVDLAEAVEEQRGSGTRGTPDEEDKEADERAAAERWRERLGERNPNDPGNVSARFDGELASRREDAATVEGSKAESRTFSQRLRDEEEARFGKPQLFTTHKPVPVPTDMVLSTCFFEVSLNGKDWLPRDRSSPIALAPPLRVESIAPAFGAVSGGTAVTVRGSGFVEGPCWVAFLMRNRWVVARTLVAPGLPRGPPPLPFATIHASLNPARFVESTKVRDRRLGKLNRGKPPSPSLLGAGAGREAGAEGDARALAEWTTETGLVRALPRLQAAWRGWAVRRSTDCGRGVAAVVVQGTVTSPSEITLVTPPAMAPGSVTVLVR